MSCPACSRTAMSIFVRACLNARTPAPRCLPRTAVRSIRTTSARRHQPSERRHQISQTSIYDTADDAYIPFDALPSTNTESNGQNPVQIPFTSRPPPPPQPVEATEHGNGSILDSQEIPSEDYSEELGIEILYNSENNQPDSGSDSAEGLLHSDPAHELPEQTQNLDASFIASEAPTSTESLKPRRKTREKAQAKDVESSRGRPMRQGKAMEPKTENVKIDSTANLGPVKALAVPKEIKKSWPEWRIQKEALKEKFKEGWSPLKKLSPDAMEGIRALNSQYPDHFTTPVLAKQFEVSPEAIRRILKSKWRPSGDIEEARRDRWDRRGERIWTELVAKKGFHAPKRWRDMGIGNGPRFQPRPSTRPQRSDPTREAALRNKSEFFRSLSNRIS